MSHPIGSRAFPGEESKIERRSLRFVTGHVFAFVLNRRVVAGIADTQRGYQLFRGAPLLPDLEPLGASGP